MSSNMEHSDGTEQAKPVKEKKQQQNPINQKQKQQGKNEGSSRPPKETGEAVKDKGEKVGSSKSGEAPGSSARQPQQGRGVSSVPMNPRSSEPVKASRLAVFDHLPRKKHISLDTMESDRTLHPAIVRLGLLYRNGAIYDDDDRVCALYAAFSNVIEDYKTPPNKNLSWDLDKCIRTQVQYLVDCRQLSMSMGNFIKFVRFTISQVDSEDTEANAKMWLLDRLNAFIEERVSVAQQNIAKFCNSAIKNDDVILTFGSSPVIRQVLLSSARTKSFRLIVVDARPLKEALKTVAALSPHVPCTYTPLSSASTVMKEATKVILGASALLSNGSVLAPAGTAMVATLAKFFNVPVIIAAESYKFCEKVQLDSIVFNEMGSCNELVTYGPSSSTSAQVPSIPNEGSAEGAAAAGADQFGSTVGPTPVLWGHYQSAAEDHEVMKFPFQVINLRYDITPIEAVSMVATEAGMIPPTSVPVLIRELRLDQTGPAITTKIRGNQPTQK